MTNEQASYNRVRRDMLDYTAEAREAVSVLFRRGDRATATEALHALKDCQHAMTVIRAFHQGRAPMQVIVIERRRDR